MGEQSGRNMGYRAKLQNARRSKRAADLRCAELSAERDAALAELRRLRQQYEWCAGLLGTHDHTGADHMEEAARDAERADRAEATLTALLDAVGDPAELRAIARNVADVNKYGTEWWTRLRRIADAKQALDKEGTDG